MKISIIIPVYNVEQFVKRCLESVIMQKSADVGLECVIVDDCCTDNSMTIVRQLISDYNGSIIFKVIEHERNRGLSAARNTGLDVSTGDYLLFVDSDDYITFDSISYFVNFLEQYPNVDIIVGNVDCNNRDFLFHGDVKTPWLIDDSDIMMKRMLSQQINICAWNKLVKRNLLLTNKIRFVEGIIFEDMTWSYWVFSHASSVLLLPKVTYVYVDNPNSITYTAMSPNKVNKALDSYTLSSSYILDSPPKSERYHMDMTVDYLLFINNIMMRASDLLNLDCSADSKKNFVAVRNRFMRCTLSRGRVILALFFLFLYSPFSYAKRIRWFRRHHKGMERLMRSICHITDFIH